MSKLRKQGFYENLPNEIYHERDGYLSSSVLKKALKGPKYYNEYVVLGLREEKMSEAALALGNYLHLALLEPHLLQSETEIYPMRTRAGKAFTSFQLENPGKTIITMSELETAEEIIRRFNTDFVDLEEDELTPCKEIFTGGKAEESLFTEIDGLPIKVRFDYAIYGKDKIIVRDLKTSSSTVNSEQEARYVCNRYNYFLSAALYVDALRTKAVELGYKEDVEIVFQFVFASKNDMNINVFQVSDETMQEARIKYKKCIQDIKRWTISGFREGLRAL